MGRKQNELKREGVRLERRKEEEGRVITGNVAEFFPGEPSVGGGSRDRQSGVQELYAMPQL